MTVPPPRPLVTYDDDDVMPELEANSDPESEEEYPDRHIEHHTLNILGLWRCSFDTYHPSIVSFHDSRI